MKSVMEIPKESTMESQVSLIPTNHLSEQSVDSEAVEAGVGAEYAIVRVVGVPATATQ